MSNPKEGCGGRFRKKKVYFSMVSNEIIRDKTISLRAKGLYAMIQSYITLDNFTLYKSFLQRNSVEGERAFDSAWRELKEKGYLIQYKLKDENNRYYYEYELLDSPHPQNVGMENLHIPDRHFEGIQIENVQNEEVQNAGYNNNLLKDSLSNKSLPNHIISEADVMDQIGYCAENLTDEVKNIITLMTEVYNMDDDLTVRINQQNMKAVNVKERFRKIKYEHIDYITLALDGFTGDIRNIRNFMLTTIYNSVSTCSVYFKTKVNHDLYRTN